MLASCGIHFHMCVLPSLTPYYIICFMFGFKEEEERKNEFLLLNDCVNRNINQIVSSCDKNLYLTI